MSIAHHDGTPVSPSHVLTWSMVLHQTGSIYESCAFGLGVGGMEVVLCGESVRLRQQGIKLIILFRSCTRSPTTGSLHV